MSFISSLQHLVGVAWDVNDKNMTYHRWMLTQLSMTSPVFTSLLERDAHAAAKRANSNKNMLGPDGCHDK